MDQTNGILVLIKRDTDSSGCDVMFGMRPHDDLPDTCCAVGNREFLETLGIKITGNFDTITSNDAFKEWVIDHSFNQAIQEFGETGSGFAVLPMNKLTVAWSAFGGDMGKGLKAVWQLTADPSWFLLHYDSGSYRGGIEADDNTFGSSFYALAAFNHGLYWRNPKSF